MLGPLMTARTLPSMLLCRLGAQHGIETQYCHVGFSHPGCIGRGPVGVALHIFCMYGKIELHTPIRMLSAEQEGILPYRSIAEAIRSIVMLITSYKAGEYNLINLSKHGRFKVLIREHDWCLRGKMRATGP